MSVQTLVDLDSYPGMTPEQAIEYEQTLSKEDQISSLDDLIQQADDSDIVVSSTARLVD